ncbi:MAG: rod shape-determining protein [bacterium]
MKSFELFSRELAIDLGTANTLVFIKGEGVVVNEPSMVARNLETNEIICCGMEAKKMSGKTPRGVKVSRPLKDGVIADFELASAMVKYFIGRALDKKGLFGPRIVLGVPSNITQVEKRAVVEAAFQAGGRSVHLVEESMAAALGAELPVEEPVGNMVVDIGGGTTEVAIITMGGMSYCKSLRVAGDELDEAIIRYLRVTHNLALGTNTAEQLKFDLATAYPTGMDRTATIKGQDVSNGIPKTLEIHEEEIRQAITDPLNAIVYAVKEALENTPPELATEISERGLVLAGGGASLWGLDKLLAQELNFPAYVPEEPILCVVGGIGKTLENTKLLKQIAIN